MALTYRCSAALKMLVEQGANLNVRPMSFPIDLINGFTPLMLAALMEDKPSFYCLLDHGADPNQVSQNGYTALMLLQQANSDDPEMTRALLAHGAIPIKKTNDGSDALYFALRRGNTPSVQLLKKAINAYTQP